MPHILQLPLGPLQTNCYILICEETQQAAIIDPAWDGDRIFEAIKEHEAEVTHILLTHTHFDHVGALAEVKKAYDVPIYCHPEAAPMLQMAVSVAEGYGLEMPAVPPIDRDLAEGDVISVGKEKLEVLYTPGHAPGHVSFYMPAHHVIFDGDVLFQGSIGRTDFPGCSFEALMASIQDKLMPLPDETQVLSGHGNPTTIGIERRTNPFL